MYINILPDDIKFIYDNALMEYRRKLELQGANEERIGIFRNMMMRRGLDDEQYEQYKKHAEECCT